MQSMVRAEEWECVGLQTMTRCFSSVLWKNNGVRWQKVLLVSFAAFFLVVYHVCLEWWAALLPCFGPGGDVGSSISWRREVGALPAKSLPAQGVGTCIPGQRRHSLTVLFISEMQEVHQGRVPPVPMGKCRDTQVLLAAFLYSAVYM